MDRVGCLSPKISTPISTFDLRWILSDVHDCPALAPLCAAWRPHPESHDGERSTQPDFVHSDDEDAQEDCGALIESPD